MIAESLSLLGGLVRPSLPSLVTPRYPRYPSLPEHISTSYIERQNLTMRMSMRRFTRLTNAFSKKIENHSAAVALYMMFYNFGRKHKTLGTTPAVKADITDHIWSVEEIVALLEKSEPKSTRPARVAV